MADAQRSQSAFTLIELLVVIAILAILAAILFPVFAQAKAAAKKASAISNAKQVGTSVAIYLADSDDLYPRAFGTLFGAHFTSAQHPVPEDWSPVPQPDFILEFARGNWANNTEPYRKNVEMLDTPGSTPLNLTNDNFAAARRRPAVRSFQMNGLLHTWSATAVNAPSSLIMFWQRFIAMAIRTRFSCHPCRYVNKICNSGGQYSTCREYRSGSHRFQERSLFELRSEWSPTRRMA